MMKMWLAWGCRSVVEHLSSMRPYIQSLVPQKEKKMPLKEIDSRSVM